MRYARFTATAGMILAVALVMSFAGATVNTLAAGTSDTMYSASTDYATTGDITTGTVRSQSAVSYGANTLSNGGAMTEMLALSDETGVSAQRQVDFVQTKGRGSVTAGETGAFSEMQKTAAERGCTFGTPAEKSAMKSTIGNVGMNALAGNYSLQSAFAGTAGLNYQVKQTGSGSSAVWGDFSQKGTNGSTLFNQRFTFAGNFTSQNGFSFKP